MTECSIEGCHNKAASRRRGFCQKHYAVMLKTGMIERLHVPDRGCKVDGCESKHDAHGYCSLHRQRWERFGDPLRENVTTEDGTPQKFIEMVLLSATDACITWPFSRDHRGYAMIARLCDDGVWRPTRVQRIVCERTYGKAKKKNEAAHECGKGHEGCVNPRHLKWKTHAENQRDMIRHGTARNQWS